MIKLLQSTAFISLFLLVLVIDGYTQQAIVTSITDGDTFRALVDGKEEKIRLIGIDTPEIHDNRQSQRQTELLKKDLEAILMLGALAKKYVESLVHVGDTVKLELDVQIRDRYSRLLSYVYLKDRRMLNELIVANGYGFASTYPPNIKYQERFSNAQREANINGKGLWVGKSK